MVDERLQFITECKCGEWSMAEVCRRFEISRITGYKWLKRYEEEGLDGLKDRSHAPHNNPRRVAGKWKRRSLRRGASTRIGGR